MISVYDIADIIENGIEDKLSPVQIAEALGRRIDDEWRVIVEDIKDNLLLVTCNENGCIFRGLVCMQVRMEK